MFHYMEVIINSILDFAIIVNTPVTTNPEFISRNRIANFKMVPKVQVKLWLI